MWPAEWSRSNIIMITRPQGLRWGAFSFDGTSRPFSTPTSTPTCSCISSTRRSGLLFSPTRYSDAIPPLQWTYSSSGTNCRCFFHIALVACTARSHALDQAGSSLSHLYGQEDGDVRRVCRRWSCDEIVEGGFKCFVAWQLCYTSLEQIVLPDPLVMDVTGRSG